MSGITQRRRILEAARSGRINIYPALGISPKENMLSNVLTLIRVGSARLTTVVYAAGRTRSIK
jgi:hypothetical protein